MKVNKLILLLTVVLFISGCSMDTQSNLKNIEYSENVESITHYFTELQTVENVYFKSKSVGTNTSRIGSTSFSITGFISISEDEKNSIFDSYDFVLDEPDFPDGISTDITEKTEFSWYSSHDFSSKILKGNFIGSVYIDSVNSIIYIDVTNS